ncbi:MAG: amidohydrolase family protein [Eggerthella lenta]
MLGHSHSGNLSAREAVQAGAIDVLCSDYYPAALLDAVFTLRDQCGLDIAKAFALVTINPAKAAGIADEVGSIAVGKRADVLLVREISCGEGEGSGEHPGARPDGRVARTMPVVTRAFVGGLGVSLALSRPAARLWTRHRAARLARPAVPPSGQV